MLHCGARFLHRRVLTLWNPQVITQKSSSSKTVPETASKKPQSSSNSLNLDDGNVFRLKTKWELGRGLLVFFLCSSPWLVQKAPKLLSFTRHILGRRLWTSALRLTLYGQFVAGETHKEIKETLQRLQHLGVRPLLAVPIEEDIGEEKEGEGWYDKNAQSMITCLDLSVGGAPNPMMQLKVTALMAAELCKTITLCLQNKEGISDLSIERVMAAMSGHEVSFSCLSQEENQHFQKSLRRLNSVAQYAVEKGVRVLVDAEYTYINPALTLVTIAMMATWNTQKPWIWNTYQAYLKDTLDRLRQDVALAEHFGVCFGVKLVRGAYLNKERKLAKEKGYPDPVQPSWEATNESYRRCLDFGLDQVSQVKERFEMIVATHNEASVTHAVQRPAPPRAMQSGRRGRLSVAGPSNQPQDTLANSPSISGDLRLLHTIDCGDQLLCCQFNNDGTRVAAGLRTGAIKVYSVNDGSLHHILADNETTSLGLPTTSLRFMPRGPAHNGDVILTTYSGGKVKLWHVSTHTCVRTITEDRQTLASCFNPSGSRFLTSGAGPGIYMYDAQTWDKLQNFLPSDSPTVMDGHMSRVYALTFFPESNERFISGGWDDTVQFWNTQFPHSQRRISGPHICGDSLSIDKTGSQILTGSWRRHNTLQIWDAETCGKIMDIPEDFRGHSQVEELFLIIPKTQTKPTFPKAWCPPEVLDHFA